MRYWQNLFNFNENNLYFYIVNIKQHIYEKSKIIRYRIGNADSFFM